MTCSVSIVYKATTQPFSMTFTKSLLYARQQWIAKVLSNQWHPGWVKTWLSANSPFSNHNCNLNLQSHQHYLYCYSTPIIYQTNICSTSKIAKYLFHDLPVNFTRIFYQPLDHTNMWNVWMSADHNLIMLLVTLAYGTLEMCSFFSSASSDRVKDNMKMGCMWSTYWLEVLHTKMLKYLLKILFLWQI